MPVKGGYQGYTGNYSAQQVLGSTITMFGAGSDSGQSAIQAVIRETGQPLTYDGKTYYDGGAGANAPSVVPPTTKTTSTVTTTQPTTQPQPTSQTPSVSTLLGSAQSLLSGNNLILVAIAAVLIIIGVMKK